MEHRLLTALERAFDWDGPASVGSAFARGTLTDPDLPARLMTPYRLLDIVRQRHLTNPQLRCYSAGTELLPSSYLSDVLSRRKQAMRQADMAAIGRILEEGGAMVLEGVDAFDPTLEVACRALGWWSGELTSANAHLAAGDTPDSAVHWYDRDMICVQLAGAKAWEVRGPSRPAPMYRDAERNLAPAEELVWSGTMRPGDAVHVPRGYWHAATCAGPGSDGFSLHVTLAFSKRTAISWIQSLADDARAETLLRTDLERLDGDDDERDAALTAALSELAGRHSPTRYLADVRTATAPARHVPYVSVLGPISGVVAVTEFEPVIALEDDSVAVHGGGKKLSFAPRAHQPLKTLLSGQPVRLHGASALARDLANHLIEQGLCAPLTDDLSSGYTGLVKTVSF
jgi:Cupin superfamily protein